MNEESVEPANPESINIIGKPNCVVIFVFGCAGGGRARGAAPRPRQVLPSLLFLLSGFALSFALIFCDPSLSFCFYFGGHFHFVVIGSPFSLLHSVEHRDFVDPRFWSVT